MENINKDIASARRTLAAEIEVLQIMSDGLGNDFITALDVMENIKGRIIVTGMGKSGHIGKKMAATLASTGSPSFFVHPGEASHGDLGMITKDDVVLAISNGGESTELSDILLYCKRYGITLIAMTRNPDSTLGKAGDYIFKLPDNGEACPLGLAPTSSTTATLALGDAIAIALLERKGFSKEDYKQRHPGGKLGAILQKVSDLMHVGNDLPFVKIGTSMQEAIIIMTEKSLGCVGVVDNTGSLIGVITDGDLRRHMGENFMSAKVEDIMTENPKTIQPNVLAAEALALMNDKKITSLFVEKDKVPVGLLHLHDCLRAGVA